MNFTPAIYEHAAKLIGATPWQTSRDLKLMVSAHAAAYRRYHHTPVVVGIDIYNLEAEAYGAGIAEPTGTGIPSITRHPCMTTADIANLPPLAPSTAGRMPMIIKAARELKSLFPEADIKVPVSGPFSLASNLVGFDNLLCDCIMAPADVEAALAFLIKGQAAFVRAIQAAGVGVTTFESAATPPLISPDMFRDIVLPALTHFLNAAATALGHDIPCIIGGNTAPILNYLMETNPGYVICPSETDQIDFMRQMAGWPEVMVRVNMNPGIIASGDDAAIRQEVNRAWELARTREKVCLGTGVLPYEAEPETIDMIEEYIREIAKVATLARPAANADR